MHRIVEILFKEIFQLNDLDEAKEHLSLLRGKPRVISSLLGEVSASEYKDIHPAWAIQLYLGRN